MNISLTQTKNSHQFNGKIQLATYLKISETEIAISAEPEVIKEFEYSQKYEFDNYEGI